MTGHVIIQTQNQTPSFLTTLQATLDILDDISGRIDENTYLTLANNLQQLHNIHTSNPTSNPTSNANPPITTPINYTRNDYVSTISNASISNFGISNANIINNNININTRNDYVSDISYASISNFDISNAVTVNDTNNNENIQSRIQSRIQSLNEESNRIGYSTRTRLILYGNVFNDTPYNLTYT